MAAPTPIIKGITTIVWGTGTGNNASLGAPSGAIVESISVTPKNAEPVADIENNDGASVVEVLLVDGFDAKATCVYDDAKAWPVEGANCVLKLNVGTGNANAGQTAYTCLVVSQAPAVARRKEAMIELNLRYRPGVTV
jgi:hypothetical protein